MQTYTGLYFDDNHCLVSDCGASWPKLPQQFKHEVEDVLSVQDEYCFVFLYVGPHGSYILVGEKERKDGVEESHVLASYPFRADATVDAAACPAESLQKSLEGDLEHE